MKNGSGLSCPLRFAYCLCVITIWRMGGCVADSPLMPKHKVSSNKHVSQTSPGTSVLSSLKFGVPAGAAIIIVAVFVVFFPSINGGFVLDDDQLLSENELIKSSDGLYRFWCTTESLDYWPVTNTSLWIEWRLWGNNPTGYHATNLVLHIVESLLIWIILRKLSIPGAFLAAMIFAVHPVNVESVAWISQLKNTMAMLFFLLSILCYLKMEVPSPVFENGLYRIPSTLAPGRHVSGRSSLWYCLSLAAFVLAMLSKGSVAVLPVLLLGIVWWLHPRRGLSKFLRSKNGTVPFASRGTVQIIAQQKWDCPLNLWDLLQTAPFFLVAVVLAVVNMWFQKHGTEIVFRTAGFTERLLGAGGVAWFYIYKAVLPINLVFIYPLWHIETGNPLWWLPLFAALAVTTVLWRYRHSWSRPLLFAWGFFCVALVPSMGFTDVGFMRYSLVADRYQHIALIGVIALTAAGWSVWHQRVREAMYWAATIVAIVAVGVLAFLTWRQSGIYRDVFTLYQATLEKNPDCCIAHNNLGSALVKAGRLQDAIEHYEQALRVNPDYPEAQANLGVALGKAGRFREAMEHYEQALRMRPDYAEVYYNMGLALVKTGQPEEAIEHYRFALALRPNYVDAHNNLGVALVQMGRPQEAIEHHEQALRLKPDYSEAHNNYGVALFQVGRLQEAIDQYHLALKLKPDYPEAYNNLGNAFKSAGQFQQAVEHYERALTLKSDYIEAHNNLGNALKSMGQFQQAIEHYDKALRFNPDFPEAHVNLGLTLVETGRPQEAIEHYKQALRLKPDFATLHFNLALAYVSMHQTSEAIVAAQKALELARSQGQAVQAKQIEDWLNSYRSGIGD